MLLFIFHGTTTTYYSIGTFKGKSLLKQSYSSNVKQSSVTHEPPSMPLRHYLVRFLRKTSAKISTKGIFLLFFTCVSLYRFRNFPMLVSVCGGEHVVATGRKGFVKGGDWTGFEEVGAARA